MKRVYLGEFEEVVLLVVALLDGDAYGVRITHTIIEHAGRDVRLNQVHAALHRMQDKGMIVSAMGEPGPERGGRRKRLFTITAYGRNTLHEARAVRAQLWSMLPPNMKMAPEL